MKGRSVKLTVNRVSQILIFWNPEKQVTTATAVMVPIAKGSPVVIGERANRNAQDIIVKQDVLTIKSGNQQIN